MSKGEAEAMLASILAPINAGVQRKQTAVFTFRQFVTSVYLPLARLRIPGDADQRSEVMAIAIPNSCRSRFRDDGDHCSDGKPITFRRSSEWRSASSESFS